jgi:hypothetical protein
MNNQYREQFTPLLCGFTLTIVQKMAAQEEGCLVQAKPLRAEDVTVTQFFCIHFRKKHSNKSVIIIIELYYLRSTRVLVDNLLLNSMAL